MSALTRAYLAEISAGTSPSEIPGTRVDVQFNPTSLRVQLSNRTAGGRQAGAQARQRPGTGEMQLNFELVFDTADEGNTDQGVSVLERTRSVERFVRPRGSGRGQEAPPRVLFVWGDFQVQGTMESAAIDLDLFDAQGVPLRARVTVAIHGQDPRWTYAPEQPSPTRPDATVPGARPAGAAGGPGAPVAPAPVPGTPGTQGGDGSIGRIVQAMPGESLAQLAARAGFEPAAWRALATGLSDPLRLELGQEVVLPAGDGSGWADGGRTQGEDANRALAGLALVPGAAAPAAAAAPQAPLQRGQALAQRGGLGGAIGQAHQATHQQEAQASLAAFGAAPTAAGAVAGRPWGAGVPLRPRRGGLPADGVPVLGPLAAPLRPRRERTPAQDCGTCGGTDER